MPEYIIYILFLRMDDGRRYVQTSDPFSSVELCETDRAVSKAFYKKEKESLGIMSVIVSDCITMTATDKTSEVEDLNGK